MGDGKRSFLSTTSEYFFSGAVKRPTGEMPIESPLETWMRAAPASGLRATWLGHSTTLIEIDGYRVLTDPVWSDRASPLPLVGPKRFHRAPVSVAELPPLDAVVISHDHFDHLDLSAIRLLGALRYKVPFITSLGVGARLESIGIEPERIVELDWWEETIVPGTELRLTATPARHFSGRTPFDRNVTLWSSFVIESNRHRAFFSGDTGLTNEFLDIRARKGPFDLIMLEVGAYHPSWGQIHLGPENALVAHRMLGGGGGGGGGAALLPVHWGTFDLALHAWDEPIETLTALAIEQNVPLLTPRLGKAIEPAHGIGQIDPWWRQVDGRRRRRRRQLDDVRDHRFTTPALKS
jgi:L-ascorbate metabolism protein UlaG (beta-lactamase superfamily)